LAIPHGCVKFHPGQTYGFRVISIIIPHSATRSPYVTNPVIELPCGSKIEGLISAFSNPKLNKAYFPIKESNCNLGACTAKIIGKFGEDRKLSPIFCLFLMIFSRFLSVWSAFLIYTELTVTHLTVTGKIMRKKLRRKLYFSQKKRTFTVKMRIYFRILTIKILILRKNTFFHKMFIFFSKCCHVFSSVYST